MGVGATAVTPGLLKTASSDDRRKMYSALLSTLKGNGFETELKEYQALEDKAKPDWLASLFVDPASGGSQVKNVAKRQEVQGENEEEEWFLQTELEGPQHYNDKRVAELAIKSMESRPVKNNAALRLAGYLEYKKVRETKNKQKNLITEASLETTASVRPPMSQTSPH